MEAPPVQYVTTSDGYSIAYTVSGVGDPLVFLPLPLNHVQLNWDGERSVRPWLVGLSDRFRVIHYDGRGQGMSTRGIPPQPSPAAWQRDLEAVVDRHNLSRFVLLGFHQVAQVAVPFAVDHPDRVHAVVLMNSSLSVSAWPPAHWALAEQSWEMFLRILGPEGASSERIERSLAAYNRATSQSDFLTFARAFAPADLSQTLPRLSVPLLVLHSRDLAWFGQEEARKLASGAQNGRLVLMDGASHMGDPASGIAAIERFLADLPAAGTPLPAATAGDGGLSAREIEVLRLIAAGKTNQQIAEALVISLNTVARHVSHIFEKTGVANRTEAAGYARDRGLA